MSMNAVIKQCMAEVPKAVAAGLVDIVSGMMLALSTVDSHPQGILDLLAPATKELFEGESVTQIENLFKKARGVESQEHYFQEIFVSSSNLWHYFGRVESDPSVVLVVVTRGDLNLGTVVVKCREVARSAKF